MNDIIILKYIFTFAFRAFSRQFYPKCPTIITFIRRKKQIYRCGYSNIFIETLQG